MNDLLPRRWAWPAAWVAIGTVILGTVALRFDPEQTSEDLPLAVVTVLGAVFFAVMGALIASRTGCTRLASDASCRCVRLRASTRGVREKYLPSHAAYCRSTRVSR